MLKRLAVFVFAFITWYLLSWPYDFRSGSFDLPITIAGIIAALAAALVLGEVLTPSKQKQKHNVLYRIGWGILYTPILFFYIVLANLDVLYRIVHPKRPINPGIVKVKTSLKNSTARIALANSITLTPGTLTVDIKDNGILYVHCLNVKEVDLERATQEIAAHFERILTKIFE